MQKILVFLVVIFVIAAIVIFAVFALKKKKGLNLPLQGQVLYTQSIINNLKLPLTEYAQKDPNNQYPSASSEQGGNGTANLVMMLSTMNFFQFEDSNLTDDAPKQLVDAWGNPMRYQPWKGLTPAKNAHNVDSYDLWSAGPDGIFGNSDDINNWATPGTQTQNNAGMQTPNN